MSTPARPKVSTSRPGAEGRPPTSLLIALLRGTGVTGRSVSEEPTAWPGPVSMICQDKTSWAALPAWAGTGARLPVLELALEELRAAEPEGPVGPLVRGHRDDEVLWPHAALDVQPGRKLGVGRLLLLRAAAL